MPATNGKHYPISDGTSRPFHIWDAKLKQAVRYRYYSDARRAHMGALIECRWAEIGKVFEVYDASKGKLLGQYARRTNDIHFLGE